jgi:uncharacterized protein (DUF2252 family)
MIKDKTDHPAAVSDQAVPPPQWTAPLPSARERMAAGKSLRGQVPHERHADYRPTPGRADPVAILEQQARTRLPALVPIRYARMLANPFAFLRGAAAVMAADLAQTPVTGLTVQACGDAHVANFGVFASAERNLIFGINDFDETLAGAWEWDLKRLAASAVVASRVLGADRTLCEEAARAVVKGYRKRMYEYAHMRHLDVWYARIDEQAILDWASPAARKEALQIMAKSREQGPVQVLAKMTQLVDDQQRIVEHKPLIVRETHTLDGHPIAPMLVTVLGHYAASLSEERRQLLSRYHVVDVARKVVGVGSVGTRCWIILLRGNGPTDPLFLQYKEAQPSVLAPYASAPAWPCQGQRVVNGQRLIQGAPDILLGWGSQHGSDFYIRQLRDIKGAGPEFDPATMNPKTMPAYCKLCGWALAMAHAKSGDAAAIAGYLGKDDGMDAAIARFAAAYAEQTERDYEALVQAAKEKRVPVAEQA